MFLAPPPSFPIQFIHRTGRSSRQGHNFFRFKSESQSSSVTMMNEVARSDWYRPFALLFLMIRWWRRCCWSCGWWRGCCCWCHAGDDEEGTIVDYKLEKMWLHGDAWTFPISLSREKKHVEGGKISKYNDNDDDDEAEDDDIDDDDDIAVYMTCMRVKIRLLPTYKLNGSSLIIPGRKVKTEHCPRDIYFGERVPENHELQTCLIAMYFTNKKSIHSISITMENISRNSERDANR